MCWDGCCVETNQLMPLPLALALPQEHPPPPCLRTPDEDEDSPRGWGCRLGLRCFLIIRSLITLFPIRASLSILDADVGIDVMD